MSITPDIERLIATHNKFFALYNRVFPAAGNRVTPSSPLPLVATTQPGSANDLSSGLDSTATLTDLDLDKEYELVHDKFFDFFYHRIVLQEPSPPLSSGGTAPESSSDEEIEVIEEPSQNQQQLEEQQLPGRQLEEQQLPDQKLEEQQLPDQKLEEQQLPDQQLPYQQLENQQRSTQEQPHIPAQQELTQQATQLQTNEKTAIRTVSPEPEAVIPEVISSDEEPATALPEPPLLPRKRTREPSVAAEKTGDTQPPPPKRGVPEVENDEAEEALAGPRRRYHMVRYTKSPSQPESSVAVEEEKRRRSPAATRVPPEALSPPVEATMQKDEKEGDETVKPRTQYIVVGSKPIPYVRQHHHNDTSAQPLRVSSNPRAPQKSKLDIVDHLWSMRFQRLRSLPRSPVRPGVTLPCLPKNLVRPATRAQLLRDARAAAAIPLSTTYEQIADKINELNASTNPPKEADRNPAVILAEKKCF